MTLSESNVQLLRGVVPLGAFALGLWLERKRRHADVRPAWRANLGLWLVDSILMAVVCGACGWAVARWAAEVHVGVLNTVRLPAPAAVLATIVGLDVVSYLWHRANHVVGWLWRFHSVHHTDSAYHVSTALRFHPGELLLGLPVRLAAILLLGAPPAGVIAFEAVFGIANVLEHGNFDLPARLERRIDRIFVTPALHRRHHSIERIERDSNFGTIFSLWDRLARTLHGDISASHFPTGLGAAANSTAGSLVAQLGLPLRRGA